MGRFFHLKPDKCIAAKCVHFALILFLSSLLCVLVVLYDLFDRFLLVLVYYWQKNTKKITTNLCASVLFMYRIYIYVIRIIISIKENRDK